MATIECLIKRVGLTKVILPTSGGAPRTYLFYPHEFAIQGQPSTSKCEVDNADHLKWMARFPNTYRVWDAAKARADMEVELKELRERDMTGFSFQKYQNKGYVIKDARDPKGIKFMDMRGEWKANTDLLEPFLTEVEAWEWLKNERPFVEPLKAASKKG